MDSEIKRLLKLSSIPGFRLSSREEQTLENWKKAQKSVKPVKTVKKQTKRAPKGYKYDNEIGANDKPALIRNKTASKAAESEKVVVDAPKEEVLVKNIVNAEDKTIASAPVEES